MIVIYHDVGGAHSSSVAANIHINRLPLEGIPPKDELLNLSTFDNILKPDYGHILFIGSDEFGSQVYTLSHQRKPQLVIPALTDMYNIMNSSAKGLMLINTGPTINILMQIGGFSSRRLHFVKFGRPIVTYGTLKAYKSIASLVREVKKQIELEHNKSKGI